MSTTLINIVIVTLILVVVGFCIASYKLGADSVQKYPENKYITIEDNRFLKDSTVEITRCKDTDDEEYLFVEVTSIRGTISFEKISDENISIDEWVVFFLNSFEG